MSFERLSDDHRPRSAEVFLDTSIFCALKKGSLVSDRARWLLKLFSWRSTSTYAKVEFGNVVLSVVQYYIEKLDKLGSLEATKSYIAHVLPSQQHGKRLWFNLLCGHYGRDDQECTERARLSLRLLMRLGPKFIDRSCDKPLVNGTDCHFAKTGLRQSRDGEYVWKTPNCKRADKRCQLDDFFVQHREDFSRIKQTIDSLPSERQTNELREFSATIQAALQDPSILLDYRNGCRSLADAILAVESNGFKNFFTQNVRESEVLTEVLRQDLYYMPNNPDGGVQLRRAEP